MFYESTRCMVTETAAEHNVPMALGRRQRRVAEAQYHRSVRFWLASHGIMLVALVVCTLIASGFLAIANNWATTCSWYVSQYPDSILDLGASMNQCHHVGGFEFSTSWNPLIAVIFSVLGTILGSFVYFTSPPSTPNVDV